MSSVLSILAVVFRVSGRPSQGTEPLYVCGCGLRICKPSAALGYFLHGPSYCPLKSQSRGLFNWLD